MPDQLHARFNKVGEAINELADELERRGYSELASSMYVAFKEVDAAHHDFAELILDPA